ncbi:pitrilysin family protein [Candidatus Halobeggiatoa sp. HSG11]|nr:pitrilysin family protein [Candidatus Halobeggiatoa sp. HSG11]
MFKYLQLIVLLVFPTTLLAGEVHEFTLDNGLKLIVKEDHRAPVAVSQVWYKIGNSYEQEGKTGLSHMLEHMMFKGTEKYVLGEFNRIMAINGASQNAFTGTDYTAYFQTLEKTRLPISFEMEADRMRGLVLVEDEFVKEREVVKEERRTRTDDRPTSLLYEYFRATAFQTSPYHNPVIGWMNDIGSLQLADLQAWYQQWYAPNNATVVVVGDIEPQAVLKLAKQYFGPLKPSEIKPPNSRPEVEQFGIKRIKVKQPAKLPNLMMGYKVPVLATKPEQWEVYALEALAYLLDGGESTRLPKNLVRGQQIASNIHVSYNLFARLESLFTIQGVPTDEHTVAELETAIYEQIKQLKDELVNQQELNMVKIKLQASQVYELDSLFYQGMKIGLLETIGLDWRIFDDYLTNIKAVTAEQIQMVARKYLIEDRLTVAVLEPMGVDK